MYNKNTSYIRTLLLLSGMMASQLCFSASSNDSVVYKQIQAIISSTYDKPDHKVETSPIAAINDYAVADWTQGDRGGRALLHRSNGKWTILACGADGLKEVNNLTAAGIPQKTAENIVSQLTTAEKSVNPNRLKKFSLFGTKDDPIHSKHHHHSNP